jgi:putative spermidine/putrescine transport system permease protein
VTVDVQAASGAGSSVRRARLRVGATIWRRPWLKGLGLLGPPAFAFCIVYVGALTVLLISSFWTVNAFTGELVHQWTLENYRIIFSLSDPTYLRIAGRTIGIAAAVTITDAVLAFPLGYFMARVAPARLRGILFIAVVLPLWSSYLVRIYAWQTILSGGGALDWSMRKAGLPAANIAYSNWAMWLVFSYVWLPFMILPVYGALERIPHSYIEASRDLGARGSRTFRSVILPLALPGVIAGSIFTFSLTLGDFITPLLIGGTNSTFIGNVVYENIGINANIPFAAALATIPVAVMAVYLVTARRLGAFDAL